MLVSVASNPDYSAAAIAQRLIDHQTHAFAVLLLIHDYDCRVLALDNIHEDDSAY